MFLVDVSGSMYRFNGQDGRLDKLLQCTVMIMEALQVTSLSLCLSLSASLSLSFALFLS